MIQAAAAGAKPLEGPTPFDALAADYDRTFGLAPSGRLFRFRLAERIETCLKPGSRLLDIGSGTGEDAVWLAARGYQVTGIDPSPAMVEVASAKARGLREAPAFHRHGLLDFNPAMTFDAAYSNFGALNCVDVADLGPALSKVLSPGGRAFLVLMGRRPLPLLFRDGPAAWKQRGLSHVRVGGASVAVSYPGPGVVARALGEGFTVDRTETLGLLVPPPSLAGWPRRHPILFGLVAALERVVARSRILAGFSDHFMIELTRL
jgi:SAM-dependent methyltransferase